MYNAYTKVEIPEAEKAFGKGWLLPLPELQDYTEKHPDIQAMEKKLGISGAKKALPSLPSKMDLRKWCSKIESQGSLGSHSPCCCRHSGIL